MSSNYPIRDITRSMYRYLIPVLLFVVIPSVSLFAQVKIGDNPNSINPASLLELESTERGFLWPRMNSSQRDGITLPPTGLTIFNTDNVCIEVNVGTPTVPIWLCLSDDSDDQQITFFELDGDQLRIGIEDGNTQSVTLNGLGTDDQQITDLRLDGSFLTITIEDGNTTVSYTHLTLPTTPYV